MIKEYLHKMRPSESQSLISRFHHRALEELIPLNATLELSTQCNFRCQHCYNFDRSKNPPKVKTTSILEISQFLTDLKKLGGLYLSLTGGEVLLSPLLNPTIKLAKKIGFFVRLKSNASLLTQERAQELSQLGVSEMDISLYGGSEKSHDEFTRTRGQFKKTLQGIKNAKDFGLQPNITFIIHRKNVSEFLAMKKICDDLDVIFTSSMDMSMRHDGSEGSLDWRVQPDDFKRLFSGDKMDFVRKEKKSSDNIQCGCARFNCAMAENGDIYPCIGAPLVAGNIFESSFENIWADSPVFNKIRGLSSEDYKKCSDCNLKSYCPRNSGTAYLNTGDYTGADPWACGTAEKIKELCET